MSFDDENRRFMRDQSALLEAAQAFPRMLALANVAAALASGLLKPGEHSVDDAVTLYREVFDKLEETGGL